MVFSKPKHNGLSFKESRHHVRNLSTGQVHEFNTKKEAENFVTENTTASTTE